MNVNSNRRHRSIVAATLGVVALSSAQFSPAANSTWVGGTDANWSTAANWSAGAPGLATGAITNDIATFSAASPGFGTGVNPVIIDLNRSIGGITFSGAAGPYVLGTNAGNQLVLSNIGAAPGTHIVQMAAAVTNAQIIAAPIRFAAPSSQNGGFSFLNNATSSSATLSFTGAISNASSASRPNVLFLDGTNTGANTISGVISANYNNNGTITGTPPGQAVPVLIKRGIGTWTLAAANSFAGTMITDTSGNAGIEVLDGTLSVQNNAALGSSGTANQLQVYIGNKSLTYGYATGLTVTVATASGGGTLELNASGANGAITLDNGVSLNLVNGGTIRSSGSNTTNGRINVANTGTVSANLATVNSSDVFTVGNEANDFTGGSATSVVHTTGPGTILLSQASNYAGGVSVDAGTTRVSNATALGSATAANLLFGTGSTGVLQFNGVNATVTGLQGTATGSAVESSSGSNSLTINNTAANQYGGTLRDGAGQLTIIKGGSGVLALTGANTYTGGTTVNAGSLLANNTSGSATGTAAVAVNSTGTVGGSGTIGGNVSVNSGGHLAPGGTAGTTGALHVGNLFLDTGSQLDYDINSTSDLDQTFVDTSGGLTINGGQLNINGAATSFTTNGVYNLLGYSGSIGGAGISALTVNAINQDTVNKSYAFGTSGGFVTLTVASVGSSANFWNTDANGNWSTPGNWTIGVPNSVGAFAAFGGGGTPITAPRTVTVDGAFTVGTVSLNNSNFAYTLAPGAGGLLTLDNGASTSFVSDSVGSHTVQVPLAMTANGANFAVLGANDTLTVSGGVSGTGTLTKTGGGTLAMTGTSTYTGGTNLNAGTLQINSGASLGDASGALTFGGGKLQLLADATTARNYQVSGSNDAVIDTNNHTLTVTGNVISISGGTGGVIKNGLGTLALNGTNTYTGTTTVNAGTLSINSNASLGATSTAAPVILNGATLASTADAALNNGAAGTNDRPIVLGTGGGTIAPATGTTLTVSGAITGSAALTKTDAGQLTIASPVVAQNTFSGGTVLNAGTIAFADANANAAGLSTGAVNFTGGTLKLYSNPVLATDAGTISNPLVVSTGNTGTLVAFSRGTIASTLTGGGTFNYQTDYVRAIITGNWSGFTGQINATKGPFGGDFRLGTTTGFGTAKVNLGPGVTLYDSINFAAGGVTQSIGELAGDATSILGSGPTAGRQLTWSIGGANTNAQFDGKIQDTVGIVAITKVGTGTWTLTNANAYTGNTAVNGGTLAINGQFALGGAVYSGMSFNGGTLQYTSTLPTAGNGTGDISQNSLGVAKPVTFAVGGATIDTNGNDVTFANAVGNAGTGGLTKRGAGTLTLNGANTYTGATTVAAGTIKANINAYTPILANANGADIQGGKLVLDYTGNSSPVGQIKTLLDNEYATNGGNFTTGQIRSTTAAANGKTLGYGDNGTDTVTIMYTLAGDADLNGIVNFNDFLALQNSFGQAGTRFDQGNFDYNGQTDFNDFLALQNNFGQSITGEPVTVTRAQVAAMTAFANSDASLVPEPTTLAFLGLGGMLLGRRRRA